MPKDNSQWKNKITLRRHILTRLPVRSVLEVFAGNGVMNRRCYSDIDYGVALDKDTKKCKQFARIRPSWAVYEVDAVQALAGGMADAGAFDLIDFDAWGDPWRAIYAYADNCATAPDRLGIVVTDGLRRKLNYASAFPRHMEPEVQKYGGRNVSYQYRTIVLERLDDIGRRLGMSVEQSWVQSSTADMTLYAAVFTKSGAES
tara:strand:- start:119 stop:724 length:606 start_codon:yes stop_codon:yes gene_type:complete